MPRVIILDTFPLNSTAKQEPPPSATPTALDLCHRWVRDCITAGNRVIAPAISYYEALRELERLNATAQIARLRAFCRAVPDLTSYAPRTPREAASAGGPSLSGDYDDGFGASVQDVFIRYRRPDITRTD